MASETTFPLLLDKTECKAPSPAREEWRVSLRWPSTRRAGLVLWFQPKKARSGRGHNEGATEMNDDNSTVLTKEHI